MAAFTDQNNRRCPWLGDTSVLSLSDFELPPRVDGFRQIVDATNRGVALRLSLDDTVDASLATRMQTALRAVVAKPDQTVLLVDCSDAHLDVDVTSGVFTSAVMALMEMGLWRRIAFQATSYPERNPAKPDSFEVLPRPEFEIWRRVREQDDVIRDILMFGDFAADSAKFRFGRVRVSPIPHFRISTSKEWLVSRGEAEVSHNQAINTAARRIINNKRFAGRTFSWGDNFIFERASDATHPGNPTTWRTVNTNHHLSTVIAAIGTLDNFEIGKFASPAVQLALL